MKKTKGCPVTLKKSRILNPLLLILPIQRTKLRPISVSKESIENKSCENCENNNKTFFHINPGFSFFGRKNCEMSFSIKKLAFKYLICFLQRSNHSKACNFIFIKSISDCWPEVIDRHKLWISGSRSFGFLHISNAPAWWGIIALRKSWSETAV